MIKDGDKLYVCNALRCIAEALAGVTIDKETQLPPLQAAARWLMCVSFNAPGFGPAELIKADLKERVREYAGHAALAEAMGLTAPEVARVEAAQALAQEQASIQEGEKGPWNLCSTCNEKLTRDEILFAKVSNLEPMCRAHAENAIHERARKLKEKLARPEDPPPAPPGKKVG